MAFYEKKWAKYWETIESNLVHKIYLELISEKILDMLDKHTGKLLDVGCGSGYLDILLEKTGFQIVGMDISEKLLKSGEKMAKINDLENRVYFIRADAYNPPFRDNTFDVSISTGYESAGAYLGATEKISKITKKGAPMIFDFVRMPNLYQPVSSVWRYFQYKKERQLVHEGRKWGDSGLKHYHYGELGLRERFEGELGLKIDRIIKVFTFPPLKNKKVCLRFENTVGKILGSILARVLLVKLINTKDDENT
jgi:ubiquinone/menaquinone biosynthesis C-methylase UbiE